MGREIAQDKNGLDQGDDPGKSLEKCLAPGRWAVNGERPGGTPHLQLCSLHLTVFPVKIPEETRVVSLGEYVVRVGILTMPPNWKETRWMTSKMKLNFPNVGSDRSSSD